ncbi:M61 family metallopeptidase [Hymenobacter busanensis]|uniref:M61 family metallopeptidase n=1 Tax=Hymenobacter busanensis TaxID=2607656 RepID=A0A7L4ZT23_9BACT|nr:PDZ domain-containing protein [Hymenobacter busanensis]KAA9339747.1 M61 family metallopeptidase [Hymenobacter busanensis]QHJ06499.1 PDZ domain-containing protein [Hymenobacter busanensis]
MLVSPMQRLGATAALLLLSGAPLVAAPTLRYVLAMPAPQTHYFEVEMQLSGVSGRSTEVKMPVWAPGSYLVREFAKNVEGFVAQGGGKDLQVDKINKNTWRIAHAGQKNLTVRYRVYANELSVRTSFVDASHGYLNGTSVFMYPEGQKQLPSIVEVRPATGWTEVSTSLKPLSNGPTFTFQASNYDELADSPFEIGNHKVLTFEANGTPHRIAMYGNANYNPERITADFKRICETSQQVVGQNPLDRYLFIIHNLERGGGGLEHLNSTTLEVSRNAYNTEAGYLGVLGLAAHEYFHLWNVKRIRPIALGPFDYDRENYTHMLWLSEGGTEYFSNQIVQRAGFIKPENYLNDLATGITRVENTPGNRVQSAAEASYDAWIKYYRPNENSPNAGISYYDKGEVIGAVLDLMIVQATNAQKSYDDVLRLLYDQYYKKLGRGFTDAEFQDAVAKVAGRRFDDFFARSVYGTTRLDYEGALGYAGLKLTNTITQPDASLGATISLTSGKPTVTNVVRDGSAWQGGLNVGDEILALDGLRATDDLSKALAGRAVRSTVRLLVTRDGQIRELSFPLLAGTAVRYRIEPVENATPAQLAVRRKWLQLKS